MKIRWYLEGKRRVTMELKKLFRCTVKALSVKINSIFALIFLLRKRIGSKSLKETVEIFSALENLAWLK